jgi:hypothetical protein
VLAERERDGYLVNDKALDEAAFFLTDVRVERRR